MADLDQWSKTLNTLGNAGMGLGCLALVAVGFVAFLVALLGH